MIINIFYVAIGGFFGAITRFKLSGWLNKKTSHIMPVGTLFVNVSGSFFLGLLLSLAMPRHTDLMLGTGFLGAFTTFSTFKLETMHLLSGKRPQALFYLLYTYLLGLGAAFIGLIVGNRLL